MSGAIDVTKTFRGEGEDMIAALIAASGAKPARETTTGGTCLLYTSPSPRDRG